MTINELYSFDFLCFVFWSSQEGRYCIFSDHSISYGGAQVKCQGKKEKLTTKKEKLAAEVKINSTAEVKTHGGSKGFLKLQRIYEITCNKYLCHMSKLTIKRIVSLDVLTS